LVERELPKLEVAGSRPVRRLQGWADVRTIQLGVPSESSLDSWADRLAARTRIRLISAKSCVYRFSTNLCARNSSVT
jgi:hypothetical protein